MKPLFISWTRPPSYWDVVGTHLPLAFITGLALLIPHLVSHDLLPLKQCTFLGLSGYPCPFCGYTRSFWAMSAGEWTFALYNCPLACLLFITTEVLFAWNAAGLLMGLKLSRGRFLRLKPGRGLWVVLIISILLVLNWAYRLNLGLK